MRIHIGKKAPKGYRELPGAWHLGRGVWVIPIEPINGRGQADRPDRGAGSSPARIAGSTPDKPINQCDGCRAGRPLTDVGYHRMSDGAYPDYMACTKDRYL